MPEQPTETLEVRPPGIRWWPAATILAIAVGVWIHIWNFRDLDHQHKNIETAKLVLGTLLLLLVWAVGLSRLQRKVRWYLCGGVVGLIAFLAAALEIRGVTGDLLPVLEWRWTKTSSELLPSDGAAATGNNTALPIHSSHDYPQFFGPDRTGKLPGPQLARDWEVQPPELLWRQPIGAAWSGFAIAGEYAVTMEQRSEKELIACYRLTTGDLLWIHTVDAHYHTVVAGEGPRSTPTIVGDRVYTLGATGILNCLSLTDGKSVWSRNIIDENESSVPQWGVSGSPLVTDEKVIVSAGSDNGRSLVAYDAETGSLVWSGGDDRLEHSSPVLATIGGVSQVLIFNRAGVAAHDIESGDVLWEYAWPGGHPHIVAPVVLSGDRVLISSGYGTGSELIHVSQDETGNWSAEQIWESKRLKSKFANIIVYDGYIYGLDDGIFTCIDLATGERQWKRGRYGHGQVLLVDDVLLVMAENGDVVLLEPTPEEHREITRFAALDGKTWNPPALAGEYLLVRNDKEAACYRLPTRSAE